MQKLEFEKFKDELFLKAKKAGFTDCEIYFEDRESLGITVYENEVDKYNLNKTFGLSFRGLFNGKMGYSYTEIIDEDVSSMLIENAISSAKSIESEDKCFLYEGDASYNEVKTYSKDLENLNVEKLINITKDMERYAKEYSDKVINVAGCSLSFGTSNCGIYNTLGLKLSNKSNILSAYVCPIIKDGDNKYDGTGYIIAENIKELDPKEIAKMGVLEALSRIGGKSIKSSKYKCIIYNEAMVSLIGAFCEIFSADSVQKGLSLLKDKEGEMIASDIVSLVDNPLLDGGLGSTPFDDEGVKTYKKDIISKGKLMTLLHNLKTANKAGVKSTGNGFKASYASPVNVSCTNLYLEKGSKSLEDMMKELDEGIMITEFSGLHSGANFITGDFSLAAKGFYVRNGEKEFPIEQITASHNFFDLLKEIVDIGDDLKFPLSSIGSPSVLVKEISIAGK